MTEEEYMAVLFEIFDPALPRLAPGDDTATARALKTALAQLGRTQDLNVLDLGCGNGASTLELARHSLGQILAVDLHAPFLDELQRRAEAANVGEGLHTQPADMAALPIDAEAYDLIWSEGALYSMGVEAGLKRYRDALKPDGVLVFSELCWFKDDVPQPCRDFFTQEYPDMKDIPSNQAMIQDCGYTIIDSFNLPESAWWLNYYLPLESRLNQLRETWTNDPDKLGIIDTTEQEIRMYRDYPDTYGYTFFILKK